MGTSNQVLASSKSKSDLPTGIKKSLREEELQATTGKIS